MGTDFFFQWELYCTVNRFFILPDICNKLFFPIKFKDYLYAFTVQTIFCSHPLKRFIFFQQKREQTIFPQKTQAPLPEVQTSM